MANVLGDTLSRFWGTLTTDDEDYSDLAVDEWVILDRLSAATGKNFSSWADYFDPAFTYKDDKFSATVSSSAVSSNIIQLLISLFRNVIISPALYLIKKHPEA